MVYSNTRRHQARHSALPTVRISSLHTIPPQVGHHRLGVKPDLLAKDSPEASIAISFFVRACHACRRLVIRRPYAVAGRTRVYSTALMCHRCSPKKLSQRSQRFSGGKWGRPSSTSRVFREFSTRPCCFKSVICELFVNCVDRSKFIHLMHYTIWTTPTTYSVGVPQGSLFQGGNDEGACL